MNKFKLMIFLAIAASGNLYASSQSTQTKSNNSHSTNFKTIPGTENFGCMADAIDLREFTREIQLNSTPDSPYTQLKKQTSKLVANLVEKNEKIIKFNSNYINELNKARNDQNHSPDPEILQNLESDYKLEGHQQRIITAMIQQNQQILINQKRLEEK